MLWTSGFVPVAHEFARTSVPGWSRSESYPVAPEWPMTATPTGSDDAELDTTLGLDTAEGLDTAARLATAEPEIDAAALGETPLLPDPQADTSTPIRRRATPGD